MSNLDVTEKGSAAELDVLTTVKEAALPLPETLSISTVGLNSITDERDETQPVDVALDAEREGAAAEVEMPEEILEDVSVQSSKAPSLAPSLAQSLAPSLAPSLASIKSVTDAVTAAAIQCIAPTECRSNRSVKEEAQVMDEEIGTTARAESEKAKDSLQTISMQASRSRSSSSKNSKLSNASKPSETVAIDTPAQGMSVPEVRSSSSIKHDQSSTSKPHIFETPLEESSCSGQISKASHKSTVSNKSSGGVIIEGHLVTVVPMNLSGGEITQGETIEVNATKLKEEKKKERKMSFFTNKLKNKMKKNKSDGSKKVRWLKKLSQLKQILPRDNKSLVDGSTPVDKPDNGAESSTDDNMTVKTEEVAEFNSTEEKNETEENQVVTKTSTEHEKPPTETDVSEEIDCEKPAEREQNITEKNDVKEFDCISPSAIWDQVNGWFQSSTKAQDAVYGEVNVAQFESGEEKKESTDVEETSMKISAVEADESPAETGFVKGFDCISPSAMWGNLNGWLKDPAKGQEEVTAAALIEAIKARWIQAPEDPKPTLNKETAADISQAVELLNTQRTLIEVTEKAIEREEKTIQEASNVEDLQAAVENKARMTKELSNAKRMETAATELVRHLFNSLTAKDRLEAIRISQDIAKAEEEVAKAEDGFDFGCFDMDPYIRTVKEEYGDIVEIETGSIGSKSSFGKGSIRRINSNASSKASSKAQSKVSPKELPRSNSAISKTLSSKSSIKGED